VPITVQHLKTRKVRRRRYHRCEIQVGQRAWVVLDIIACASRFRLVYGDRLLGLLHVTDPQLRFEPVGRVGVVSSRREGSCRAREVLA